MSLKVEYSAFALSCLNEIYDYIFTKSKSNRLAQHQIDLIFNVIEIIKQQPEVGKKDILLEYKKRNIRFIVKGEYKVIYEYTGDKLKIIDIFHTKQNPDKITSREQYL